MTRARVGFGRPRSARSRQGIIGLAVSAAALPTVLAGAAAGQTPPQTDTDSYTRYELLEPGSAAFRIVYDVSATTAGARFYYNSIRQGAEETVHGVTDLHTGDPLEWTLVDGAHARANGHPRASVEGRYIKVTLARAVPEGGQGRIRIDKTYSDPESYFVEDGDVVFSRSLGIRRNAVVLPVGYELLECNYPCQVAREGDGRIKASYTSPGPAAVPFLVRGRRLANRDEWTPQPPNPAARNAADGAGAAAAAAPAGARVGLTFGERAFEDRDITYFLEQPETSAFRLFHDYTESRPGVDRYLNIVRRGSRASDPKATILDTGEELEIETLRGEGIARAGVDIGRPPTEESEVVVIRFDPVREGHSVRLRIWETYTDPGRYVLAGDELVWDRGFGRSRNTVVLPDGWYLTSNAIPAVVDTIEDGRIRLRYVNPRPDEIRVFVTARRR